MRAHRLRPRLLSASPPCGPDQAAAFAQATLSRAERASATSPRVAPPQWGAAHRHLARRATRLLDEGFRRTGGWSVRYRSAAVASQRGMARLTILLHRDRPAGAWRRGLQRPGRRHARQPARHGCQWQHRSCRGDVEKPLTDGSPTGPAGAVTGAAMLRLRWRPRLHARWQPRCPLRRTASAARRIPAGRAGTVRRL